MTQPAAKPAVRTAEQIAAPLSLSEPAKAQLNPKLSAREYLDVLVGLNAMDDALRFLAAALPKREAVWWSVSCLRRWLKAPSVTQIEAIQVVEAWVKDPTEANRRAAEKTAETAGFGTEVGCAALGAFWSGGSLAPPHVTAVPPKEELTALAVGNSLAFLLAKEPLQADENRAEMLKIGLEIAAGKSRWS